MAKKKKIDPNKPIKPNVKKPARPQESIFNTVVALSSDWRTEDVELMDTKEIEKCHKCKFHKIMMDRDALDVLDNSIIINGEKKYIYYHEDMSEELFNAIAKYKEKHGCKIATMYPSSNYGTFYIINFIKNDPDYKEKLKKYEKDLKAYNEAMAPYREEMKKYKAEQAKKKLEDMQKRMEELQQQEKLSAKDKRELRDLLNRL
jgi:hypothetical protein